MVTGMVLLYLWQLNAYALNIPHWDDHAIRIFIEKSRQNPFFGIKHLFDFHNEHIIFTTRALAWVTTLIEGQLNFKTLIFIGNIFLMLILGLLLIVLKSEKREWFWFPIAAALILNCSHYENAYWGMASIQNFGVLAWAVWAFYLLIYDKKIKKIVSPRLLWAFVMSGMAVITSGNGIFVPIIGLLILLLRQRWKTAGVWSIAAALLLSLFFYHFPGKTQNDAQITLAKKMVFFIDSLGSFAQAPIHPHWLAFVAGTLIFLVMVSVCIQILLMLARNFKPENAYLFYLSVGLYALSTLLVVTYTRANYGLPTILSSKYMLYSSVLVLVTFLFLKHLLPNIWHKNLNKTIIVLSLIGFINVYLRDKINLSKTYGDRIEELNNEIMEESETSVNSIYKIPTAHVHKNINLATAIIEPNALDSIAMSQHQIDFFDFKNKYSKNKEFVLLHNQQNEFVVQLDDWPKNQYLSTIIPSLSDRKKGSLTLQNFPDGIYDLYVIRENPKENTIFNAEKTIKIAGVKYLEPTKNW